MRPLAVQMYSVRDAGSLAQQAELISKAGLTAVELTSSNFENPAETLEILGSFGLSPCGGHVGLNLLRDVDRIARASRVLGIKDIVLWGFDEEDLGPDPAIWSERGLELGRLAEELETGGLRLSFHNHDWELRRFGTHTALELLFEAAGPSLGWQADLAWLARGGADVPETLSLLGHRLRSVHLKDLSHQHAAAEEGWADLGYGTLPWPAWIDLLADYPVQQFVLEHDAPSDPERFLVRSAAYAKELIMSGATA